MSKRPSEKLAPQKPWLRSPNPLAPSCRLANVEAAVVHHDNDTDLRHGVEHIQIHHRAVMKNSHISDFQKEKFLPGHVN